MKYQKQNITSINALGYLKKNRGLYAVPDSDFDETKMLDISGLFPLSTLTGYKIVLNLPGY